MSNTDVIYKKECFAYEIVEMVERLHYNFDDFDEGDLIDRIYECSDRYILTEIPIENIENPFYAISSENVKSFMTMNVNTMPPIVLGIKYDDKYSIIDGCHRIITKKKLKLKTIMAYIPIKYKN